MPRRTKIVATIGPASDSPEQLEALLRAGVNVARLNLSHGPVEAHLEKLQRIRAAAERVDHAVGVLADLPGPKVRAGKFPDGGIVLDAGAPVRLRSGVDPSDADLIHVDYPTLLEDLRPRDPVIIGDGGICLRVERLGDDEVEAIVLTGGSAQGRPGVHIPSENLRLSTPTEDDLVLAKTMVEAGADFVAVSFVRTAADIEQVRAVVGRRVKLIAKIETSTALANLQEIIGVSDAIMVARGDLGIDCPIEDLPHLQKSIVRQCVEYGIPAITATQMLESMVSAPSPTRAEVTDVANAIFDGTDALMLSGETAIGHDPVLVVETMDAIAARAEAEAAYRQWAQRLGRIQRAEWDSTGDRITAALTHAASEAAVDVGASAIICCTHTGRTAIAMARFRPEAPLIALSNDPRTVRQLSLLWGVETLALDTFESTDEIVWHAVERVVQAGLVEPRGTVVVLAGSPKKAANTAADVLRIVRVD